MSRKKRPIITCECGCGRVGPHKARGLVSTCHDRARHAGRLEDYPRKYRPRPLTAEQLRAMAARATAGNVARGQARLEDYVWLREQGQSRPEATARVGVTDRTVQRYHRILRESGATYRWLWDPIPPHILARITTTETRKALAA